MELFDDFFRSQAQRSFAGNQKERKLMFEKYQVLLENGLTFKEITERMLSRAGENNTPKSVFLQHMLFELQEGREFSDGLKGWASTNEIMIIASGEAAGDVQNAFKQCVDLMAKLIMMKKTVVSSSIYPAFLMVALFGIIYGFANFMVPILEDFSDPVTWPDFAVTLRNFTLWVSNNFGLVMFMMIGGTWGMIKSLPILKGNFRDKILDRIPPYSLYKEIQSGLFLSAISNLMNSGMTFTRSLQFIEQESSPYVQDKIQEIIDNTNEGKSEGEAMNIDFIGEVGNDIEDFSMGADIGVAMSRLGDAMVNEKIEKIEKASGVLKFLAMIVVFVFVLWAYGSFISITQNMEVV